MHDEQLNSAKNSRCTETHTLRLKQKDKNKDKDMTKMQHKDKDKDEDIQRPLREVQGLKREAKDFDDPAVQFSIF